MFVVAHNGARIWGGAERATVKLLAGLAERGHRVLLLCGDPGVAEQAAAYGVRTEVLRLGGDLVLTDALRLARRLRRDRPDVFLVGTFKKLPLAALGARLAGVPRVVARVGLETDTPRRAKYRVALRLFVDAVALNASRSREAFLALPGWSEEKVRVIYNGIRAPERRAPAGELRRSLGIAEGSPVIGTVARLARQKRLDRLIRALAELPGVHAIVAGEGTRREELERLAAELRVADRLHLLGHREDVGDVLDALDLYVVCSDTEGMSNSMLEAMASGLPVISTDVSGAREALETAPGREAGRVIGFGEGALAPAIGELLADRPRLDGMARSARSLAAERFGWSSCLDEWERFLAPSADGGGAPESSP